MEHSQPHCASLLLKFVVAVDMPACMPLHLGHSICRVHKQLPKTAKAHGDAGQRGRLSEAPALRLADVAGEAGSMLPTRCLAKHLEGATAQSSVVISGGNTPTPHGDQAPSGAGAAELQSRVDPGSNAAPSERQVGLT